MDFWIISKSVQCSTGSKMTGIYTGRSEVQILAAAKELSLLQNIQTSSQHPPSLQLNENQNPFSGREMTTTHSLNIRICLEQSLEISGSVPPLNLSVCMTYILTHLYFTLTPSLCTYLSTGQILYGLIKEL
jgi:hypothetical protein